MGMAKSGSGPQMLSARNLKWEEVGPQDSPYYEAELGK